MSKCSNARDTLILLEVLLSNFAYGHSLPDLAKATGFSAPKITRHLHDLMEQDFAEKIPETGRYRVSHNVAQQLYQGYKNHE